MSVPPKHKVDISIVNSDKNSTSIADEVFPRFLEDTFDDLLDGLVKFLGWDEISNTTITTWNEDSNATSWDEIFNTTTWNENPNDTSWDDIFNITTKDENPNPTIFDEEFESNDNSSETELIRLEFLPVRFTRMVDNNVLGRPFNPSDTIFFDAHVTGRG